MKISFVILHYQNKEDTENCISTIKKMKNSYNVKYEIIIVDNKSPNESGKELSERYCDDENVKIVLLDKNYGFSIANNIGYRIAKDQEPNLILVCNNDILFEYDNFLDELVRIFEKEEIEILIPDVINFNGYHQNPMKNKEDNLFKAVKNCIFKFIISFLLNIPIINKMIYTIEVNRETKWFKKYYNSNRNVFGDFVPIGAFIIYGEKWITEENIAFPSNTFLYCEEDFLVSYIKKRKYKIKYCDLLKVKHLEGRSTKTIGKNEYKNLAKKYQYQAIALTKYIVFFIRSKR